MKNDPAQKLFVLSNDSDPDGDPLSISTITPPLHGQADIVENNTAIRYTPAVGYSGVDRFVYTVSDGDGGTASAAIIVRVQATYTLSIAAINGSVAKSPDKTTYLQGETVTLTAAADTGYTFAGWSGDVSGTDNPVAIAMNSHINIVANYVDSTPELVALWKLDENTGTIAMDTSGNNHTASLRNNPEWIPGDGLSFSNHNEYLEIPDSPAFTMSSATTLSVWVKLRDYDNDWPKIIIKPHLSYATPWEMFAVDLGHYGNSPRFLASNGIPNGASAMAANSTLLLNLNQWYHIVGTYDGRRLALYLDGTLVATDPIPFSIGTNSAPLNIGGRLGNNTFNGYISDVCIYNGALNAIEVQTLFEQGRP
jgi:uncharacterized repeat protein (TIGR02543 family)